MSLFEAAPFLNSCVDRLGSCVPSIPERLVLVVVVATVLLAFGTIAVHAATAYQPNAISDHEAEGMHQKAVIFSLLIVVGLVINAALCGAISGPHPRYQTRVIWLAVMAAVVLEAVRPIVVSRLARQGWPWRLTSPP